MSVYFTFREKQSFLAVYDFPLLGLSQEFVNKGREDKEVHTIHGQKYVQSQPYLGRGAQTFGQVVYKKLW